MGIAGYRTEDYLADLRGEWAFKAERPEQGLEESGTGNAELDTAETIHILLRELCKFGYVIIDLYELTLAELVEMLEANKEQLAYTLWKQAGLIGMAIGSKKYPETPKDASPELYPAPKRYKMPEFLKERLRGRESNG